MSWPCRPAGLPVGIVLGARGHARPALCRAGQRLRGRRGAWRRQVPATETPSRSAESTCHPHRCARVSGARACRTGLTPRPWSPAWWPLAFPSPGRSPLRHGDQ